MAPQKIGMTVLFLAVLALIGAAMAPTGCGDRGPVTPAELATLRRDVAKENAARSAGAVAEQGATAEANAEDAVKAQLRDPESATFRDVRAVPHQNGMAVCGEVNAKNGFGGYTGYEYFMVAGKAAVVRSDENAAQFQRLWKKSCQ